MDGKDINVPIGTKQITVPSFQDDPYQLVVLNVSTYEVKGNDAYARSRDERALAMYSKRSKLRVYE